MGILDLVPAFEVILREMDSALGARPFHERVRRTRGTAGTGGN